MIKASIAYISENINTLSANFKVKTICCSSLVPFAKYTCYYSLYRSGNLLDGDQKMRFRMRCTFGISFLIYRYFSGKNFFVILIILLQKFRCIQFIWTFFSCTGHIPDSFQFFSFPPAFAESASRHSVRGAA